VRREVEEFERAIAHETTAAMRGSRRT
jgi:hypothetical protein